MDQTLKYGPDGEPVPDQWVWVRVDSDQPTDIDEHYCTIGYIGDSHGAVHIGTSGGIDNLVQRMVSARVCAIINGVLQGKKFDVGCCKGARITFTPTPAVGDAGSVRRWQIVITDSTRSSQTVVNTSDMPNVSDIATTVCRCALELAWTHHVQAQQCEPEVQGSADTHRSLEWPAERDRLHNTLALIISHTRLAGIIEQAIAESCEPSQMLAIAKHIIDEFKQRLTAILD